MKFIEYTSTTENIKKSWFKKYWAWLIIIVILGQLYKCNSSKTGVFELEGVSKSAYETGYSEGKLLYGNPTPLPYVYFFRNHSEINKADEQYYKDGYNAGVKYGEKEREEKVYYYQE